MNQLPLFDISLFQSPSQPVYDPYWDEMEAAPEQVQNVREQASDTQQAQSLNDCVREQVKSAPEHTHWIEEYWVKRGNKKHYYYRYCWMTGRKMNRLHIGSVNSAIALNRKLEIEDIINDGQTPSEIQELIRSWR